MQPGAHKQRLEQRADRISRTMSYVLWYDREKVCFHMDEVQVHMFKGRCPHEDIVAVVPMCMVTCDSLLNRARGVKLAAAERAQVHWPQGDDTFESERQSPAGIHAGLAAAK